VRVDPGAVTRPGNDGADPARKVALMSSDKSDADKKIEHKTEELGGKAKEAIGKATDDENLEMQGKNDQTKSNIKQAGQKIKDAFKK
jgi:uncharacterized protein YjbJ (UPF0337 family)